MKYFQEKWSWEDTVGPELEQEGRMEATPGTTKVVLQASSLLPRLTLGSRHPTASPLLPLLACLPHFRFLGPAFQEPHSVPDPLLLRI